MTTLIHSPPYSLKKVSQQISKVTGYTVLDKATWTKDDIIIISNPDDFMARVIALNFRRVKAIYSVMEGTSINFRTIDHISNWSNMYGIKVFTPSKYSKFFHDIENFNNVEVLPHAIETPLNINNRYPDKKVFGYISAYMERKYPKFLEETFKRTQNVYYYIKTSKNNPFNKYFKQVDTEIYKDTPISDYYLNIDVYVNFSNGGGFEMTPLEAISYGIPTIIPDIPLFRETILQYWNNYPLLVKSNNDYYIWKCCNFAIVCWNYDPIDLANIINNINDMNKEQYYNLKQEFVEKGIPLVKEHYPLSLYERFKQIELCQLGH